MNDLSKIKCVAFDCFGTVFDMSPISREEIRAYVEHVRRNDFSLFDFPASWWELVAHDDAFAGLLHLQTVSKVKCVALSNGSVLLLERVSTANGLHWDHIIDLAKHRVYKPHLDAYRTVEKDLGFKPEETLMVTANPTFGDIEGAAAVGMQSQVIRQPGTPQNMIALAKLVAKAKGGE